MRELLLAAEQTRRLVAEEQAAAHGAQATADEQELRRVQAELAHAVRDAATESAEPLLVEQLQASRPRRTAWVLDTDLGWDPDDILALLLMVQHCKLSGERLAVITSAEVPTPAKGRVVRCICDSLVGSVGELGGQPLLVASGGIQPQGAGHAAAQPLADGLHEIAERVPADAVGTLDDIRGFIGAAHDDGHDVTWFGIR